WLGSSLLVALDWALAITLAGPAAFAGRSAAGPAASGTNILLVATASGTPNWLDALLFCTWAALAGRWLDPLARLLARRRFAGWACFAVLLVAALWLLPWVLFPWVTPFVRAGLLPAASELPYVVKPLIVQPYRSGAATPLIHALTATML